MGGGMPEMGEREDTYFLPKGALAGQTVKPGDIVRFRVVHEDEEGNIEVEYATEGKSMGSGFQDDLRKTVGSKEFSGPETQEY